METGPIYGVSLIDTLPLAGGMTQQMPSRGDLERVAKISQRTVAGYEVGIHHLERLRSAVAEYLDVLDNAPDESETSTLRAIVAELGSANPHSVKEQA